MLDQKNWKRIVPGVLFQWKNRNKNGWGTRGACKPGYSESVAPKKTYENRMKTLLKPVMFAHTCPRPPRPQRVSKYGKTVPQGNGKKNGPATWSLFEKQTEKMVWRILKKHCVFGFPDTMYIYIYIMFVYYIYIYIYIYYIYIYMYETLHLSISIYAYMHVISVRYISDICACIYRYIYICSIYIYINRFLS